MSTFKFEGKTQEEKSADFEKADAHIDVLFDIDRLEAEKAEVETSIKELEDKLEAFDKLEDKKNNLLKKTDSIEIDHSLLKKRKKLPRTEVPEVSYDAPDKAKLDQDFDKAFNDALEIEDETVEDEKKNAVENINESEKEIERLTEELKKRDSVQAKYYRLRKRAKKIASDLASSKELADKNDAVADKTGKGASTVPTADTAVPAEALADLASTPETAATAPEKNNSENLINTTAVNVEERAGNARDQAIEGDIYPGRFVHELDRDSEKARSIRNQIRLADTFPKLWRAIDRTKGYTELTPEEIKDLYVKFFKDKKSVNNLPEEFGIRFQALNPFLQREAETYNFNGPTEMPAAPQAETSPEAPKENRKETPHDHLDLPEAFPGFERARSVRPAKEASAPEPRGIAKLFAWLNGKKNESINIVKTKRTKKAAAKVKKEKVEPTIEPSVVEVKQEVVPEAELSKYDEVVDAIHADTALKSAYKRILSLTYPKEPAEKDVDAHMLQLIAERYPTSEDLEKVVFAEQKKEAMEPDLAKAVNALQQKLYGKNAKPWNFAKIEAEKIEKNGAPVSKEETLDTPQVALKEAESIADSELSPDEHFALLDEALKKDKKLVKSLQDVFDKYALMDPKKNPRFIQDQLRHLYRRSPTKEGFRNVVKLSEVKNVKEKGRLLKIEKLLYGTKLEIAEPDNK